MHSDRLSPPILFVRFSMLLLYCVFPMPAESAFNEAEAEAEAAAGERGRLEEQIKAAQESAAGGGYQVAWSGRVCCLQDEVGSDLSV